MKNLKRSLQVVPLMFMLIVLVGACKKDDVKPLELSTPVLSNATNIAKTSFKISWASVKNASEYYVDVSEKSDFTTTVTGYKQKKYTTTNASISGLKANTKYYVRVKASKGTTKSKLSATKNVTTLK